LLVRIKAPTKRIDQTPIEIDDEIVVNDLVINVSNSVVTRNGQEINLSPKEYKLLLILAKAKGRVMSKNAIADQIWDYNIENTNNTIEVYINFLRRKIDKGAEVKLIHTKPGYGYYLKEE